MHATFKIMLPTAAGSTFSKKRPKIKRLGAMSDKKTKKTVDDTRNSQNRRCGTYIFFRKAALEAKNARDCSQKLLFQGGMDRKIANREGKGTTRANKSGKQGSHQGRLGVRKVICLMQSARSRSEKICFPLQREAHFWKNGKKNTCG